MSQLDAYAKNSSDNSIWLCDVRESSSEPPIKVHYGVLLNVLLSLFCKTFYKLQINESL